MPRNSNEARKNLREAAIELFSENGFDETTAAQIAARAGVTERTFFRHFADKREVLFDGQQILGSALAEAIGDAGPELSPIETVRRAFNSVAPLLEANRRFSEPRQRIIAATPALQEREAAKRVAMAREIAEALARRGVPQLRAELVAQAGSVVLGHALAAWFAEPSVPLREQFDRAFAELQSLAAPTTRR